MQVERAVVTFEELLGQHTRELLGLAAAITTDRYAAEDVVQEVLIKSHRRWNQISQLDAPLLYIRRMVINESISWRRRTSRIHLVAEMPDTEASPDHATSHADRSQLQEQLRTLTGKQRAVLALRFYAGYDDNEIAELLDCSTSTVRSHASRALAALRAQAQHPVLNSSEN